MRSYLNKESEDMKNVKLIASDMDHTLLMENGKLPDGFFDYIDRLDEKGIRFVVASGRPMYTLRDMFGDKMDKMVVIGDNGAAISNCGKIIYKSLMDVEEYQSMIRFVEDETDGVECASQPVSNPKTKKSKGGILITVQTMGGLFIKKVGLIMTV